MTLKLGRAKHAKAIEIDVYKLIHAVSATAVFVCMLLTIA